MSETQQIALLQAKITELESDLSKAVDLVKTLRGKFNKYGYLERHSLGDQLTNFIDLFLFTKSKIESSHTVKPEQTEEPNGEKLSKAMGYEPTESQEELLKEIESFIYIGVDEKTYIGQRSLEKFTITRK